MKRKLVIAGVVMVLASVVVLIIAARNAPATDRSNEHYRVAVSSRGQVTLEPGTRPKMSVTYQWNTPQKSLPQNNTNAPGN